MKQLVIVTGLSGSGKSIALRALEDSGYYCIDNLPATMLPHIAEHLQSSGGQPNTGVSSACDIGRHRLAFPGPAIDAAFGKILGVHLHQRSLFLALRGGDIGQQHVDARRHAGRGPDRAVPAVRLALLNIRLFGR